MPSPPTRWLVACLLLLAAPGCNLVHNYGSGAHLDDPRPAPHHPTNVKNRDLLVEITTDAGGAVAAVEFKRSSGSEAVDGYVAQNIRDTWPGQPSTRALVELSYSAEKGFGQPRLVSSSPAS